MTRTEVALKRLTFSLIPLMIFTRPALAHPAGYYNDVWLFVPIIIVITYVIPMLALSILTLIVVLMVILFRANANKKKIQQCFCELAEEKLALLNIENHSNEEQETSLEVVNKRPTVVVSAERINDVLVKVKSNDYMDYRLFIALANEKIENLIIEKRKCGYDRIQILNIKDEKVLECQHQIMVLQKLVSIAKFQTIYKKLIPILIIVLAIPLFVIYCWFDW